MSSVIETDERGQPDFVVGFKEAVQSAWSEMVATKTKWGITDMITGDDAAAELLARLPIEMRDASLPMVRRALFSLSKNAQAATSRPRTNEKRELSVERLADRIVKSFPQKEWHSSEYTNQSDDLKKRMTRHKMDCGYRCQLCGRIRTGELLEVHHVNYDRFGGNELITDLLCVCKSPCHKYADGLRRWGIAQEQGNDQGIDLLSDLETDDNL